MIICDNLIVGSKEGKLCWFDMDLSSKPYKTINAGIPSSFLALPPSTALSSPLALPSSIAPQRARPPSCCPLPYCRDTSHRRHGH
ncbi:hypothetical protein HN51_001532 [Arachis hypogaea]